MTWFYDSDLIVWLESMIVTSLCDIQMLYQTVESWEPNYNRVKLDNSDQRDEYLVFYSDKVGRLLHADWSRA